MPDVDLLGPWIKRFLLEYVQGERNLSLHTQKSYRDTLVQLIPFLAARGKRKPECLSLADLSRDSLRLFLSHVEITRKCSVATRNQRLAGIHSLARYVASISPVHLSWSIDVCAVPFKRSNRPLVPYLEKDEMDAILDAPARESPQGRREYALLLFLYNSGARADEAAQLTISQLHLPAGKQEQSRVTIHGKWKKIRQCPLWKKTAEALHPLIDGRPPLEHVFLNRKRQPLTRFGIYDIVKRSSEKAGDQVNSLITKRVSPHVIRHTTATHLLRAGVDINTIRAWLGHVSIATTSIYAEIDLAAKAKALANCEGSRQSRPSWKQDAGLMAFLRGL
jgi:integrase/recombinase XerD